MRKLEVARPRTCACRGLAHETHRLADVAEARVDAGPDGGDGADAARARTRPGGAPGGLSGGRRSRGGSRARGRRTHRGDRRSGAAFRSAGRESRRLEQRDERPEVAPGEAEEHQARLAGDAHHAARGPGRVAAHHGLPVAAGGGAGVDGDAVLLGELDRLGVEHPGPGLGQLLHLLVGDLRQAPGLGHHPRVGGEDAGHVAVDLAASASSAAASATAVVSEPPRPSVVTSRLWETPW